MTSIGIDIGSTATKAVVIAEGRVIYKKVSPTGFSSVDAAERVAAELAQAGYDVNALPVIATGYGRVAVPYANKVVTEITCHGRGAAHLFGPDGVAIDVGGQDTKVIALEGGKVSQFLMNDKCSAGTGKFLEIMANRMAVSQSELASLASVGQKVSISSMCTVFAESEVISLIGQGTPREDIANGVIESVVARVCVLASKISSDKYVLTGGLCENDYVVKRLSAHLKAPVETCADARFAGAIGAALSA
jgi:predicted CoA-substrate-specific enzyme activase